MKRGAPLKRTGGLKRGKALRRRPKPKLTEAQLERRQAWFEEVTRSRVCGNCEKKGGRLEGHHVIPKSYLRLNASRWEEDVEDLVWAAANGMVLCPTCHELHTRRVKPITRDKLPPAAITWAWQHGLLDLLKTQYPPEEKCRR